MKIKLLGALDYNKLNKQLNDRNIENVNKIIEYMKELKVDDAIDEETFQKLEKKLKNINNSDTKEILEYTKHLEIASRTEKVAAAGRLSRFAGDVFETIGVTEDNSFENNIAFVKRVINMGHDSITDHDYLVFALKDISPVIEQTIIAERFSSFTVKSRREVDFSKVGFYMPDFYDKNGILISNNMNARIEYKKHMQSLFETYSKLEKMGLPKEDARFILPYCYHSNIIMGIDAHTLKDMIIRFTKTHLANIQELREFGEKLFDIAFEYTPYIVDQINSAPFKTVDPVSEYLKENNLSNQYIVLDSVKLLKSSEEIDDSILIAALMRRYQYDYNKARKVLSTLSSNNPMFKSELMKKIVFEGDKLELSQVNFEFQIPISLAVLTHLTRHRTQQILIP